jgi:hypothetical protein
MVPLGKPKEEKRGACRNLYVNALVRVPVHIPAWTVAEVRKYGANADLGLRLGVIVLGSPILLMDRVIGLDGHGGKWIASVGNLEPDHKIVDCIRERRQQGRSANNAEEYAFQPFPSRCSDPEPTAKLIRDSNARWPDIVHQSERAGFLTRQLLLNSRRS